MTKYLPYLAVALLAFIAGAIGERVRNSGAAMECMSDDGECIGVLKNSDGLRLGTIKFYPASKVTINEN